MNLHISFLKIPNFFRDNKLKSQVEVTARHHKQEIFQKNFRALFNKAQDLFYIFSIIAKSWNFMLTT